MLANIAIQSGNFSQNDIEQIINIHRQEIHKGFLTSLGDKALRLLFSMAANSKHSLLITVKDTASNTQVGFLLGVLDTGSFYKDFVRKKFIHASIILFPKLFSLNTVRKMIEVMLYPAKKELQEFPEAELLDLAILSGYQGEGIAKKLFYEFSRQLGGLGVDRFKITTGKELVSAQRFYEAMGANEAGEIEVHKGSKTIVYIYEDSIIHEKKTFES